MATDSVKFLNEKCLVQAHVKALRCFLEEGRTTDVERYQRHLQARLGQLLGAEIVGQKAEQSSTRDPETGDYEFRAEVYVLSPVDMRKLYHMIREEVRKEVGGQ